MESDLNTLGSVADSLRRTCVTSDHSCLGPQSALTGRQPVLTVLLQSTTFLTIKLDTFPLFSFAGYPNRKVVGGRCSERFCCVSFRLAKRPPWRPVGSGNSTCHPTLEACPKTGTLSCHGQSCPRFQLRVLWALILEQGFLPYQLAHNAIKRLLRRSFHRARFHVESVANRNAYLLKQAIGALNSCVIYTTPKRAVCCKSRESMSPQRTRLALRHGTPRQDVKTSLY